MEKVGPRYVKLFLVITMLLMIVDFTSNIDLLVKITVYCIMHRIHHILTEYNGVKLSYNGYRFLLACYCVAVIGC